MKLDKSKIDPVSKLMYRKQISNLINNLAFEMHLKSTDLESKMRRIIYKYQNTGTVGKYIKQINSYLITNYKGFDIYFRTSYTDMGDNCNDINLFYFKFIDLYNQKEYNIQGYLDYWI